MLGNMKFVSRAEQDIPLVLFAHVKECLLAYAILVPLEYVILGSNDHMFLRELCSENVRYILRKIVVVFRWNKSR